MRIGIVGSWRSDSGEWKRKGAFEEFQTACRTLGRKLAASGTKIIVGGQSESTADFHVVDGVLNALDGHLPDSPLIEILRPEQEAPHYWKEATAHPGVFEFHDTKARHWFDAHLLALREADCLLAIGGAEHTYHAGLAAIVARKPLVPVGSFGGAASRLVQALGSLNPAGPGNSDDLRALNAPWTDTTLARVFRMAGIGRRPRILIVHGHDNDRRELQAWLETRELCQAFIMQEEFANGRTIPEKFEEMAKSMDGAIALATPDDLGGAVGEGCQRNRARQNVWIEAGWFWGRLGRHSLLLLCKGDIEIPSDLQGVEHYPYASGTSEQAKSITTFIRRLAENPRIRS